jgi:hypothetical protein
MVDVADEQHPNTPEPAPDSPRHLEARSEDENLFAGFEDVNGGMDIDEADDQIEGADIGMSMHPGMSHHSMTIIPM